MKKYLLILFFCLFAFSLIAQEELTLNQINEKAIQAYRDKDYSSALENFRLIENNGIINADLFYNIANCHFRLGSLGLSILYYEKCLKVKPNHTAARKNRDFALTLTRDKIEKEEPGVLEKMLTNLYNSFDLNSIALLNLILVALLIFLLILMQLAFRGKDKSLPAFFIFLLLIFLVASITISWLKYESYYDTGDAVITATTAIGFSGPGEEYTRVFTIHEGMLCHVEDASEDWLLIKLENGIGGWIKKDLLHLVSL